MVWLVMVVRARINVSNRHGLPFVGEGAFVLGSLNDIGGRSEGRWGNGVLWLPLCLKLFRMVVVRGVLEGRAQSWGIPC